MCTALLTVLRELNFALHKLLVLARIIIRAITVRTTQFD
jgi:hypothetical protein